MRCSLLQKAGSDTVSETMQMDRTHEHQKHEQKESCRERWSQDGIICGFLYKLSYSSNEYKNDKSNEQPLEMEMDR